MTWKTCVLVVANQTADSDELVSALSARSERGPTQFPLLLPSLLGTSPGQSEARLAEALQPLRAAGPEMDGEVGDCTAATAVKEAEQRQQGHHPQAVLRAVDLVHEEEHEQRRGERGQEDGAGSLAPEATGGDHEQGDQRDGKGDPGHAIDAGGPEARWPYVVVDADLGRALEVELVEPRPALANDKPAAGPLLERHRQVDRDRAEGERGGTRRGRAD